LIIKRFIILFLYYKGLFIIYYVSCIIYYLLYIIYYLLLKILLLFIEINQSESWCSIIFLCKSYNFQFMQRRRLFIGLKHSSKLKTDYVMSQI